MQIDLKKLDSIVPKFQRFLETEGQQWSEERHLKDEFFEKYFSKEGIEQLEAGTLRELIHILWAFNGWTNKDYLLHRMMESGLPTIQEAFKQLFYGDNPIKERFDFIRKNVKMLGAACISEMLTHHDHKKYPIYNSRSKDGLLKLGIPEDELPKSRQISGTQYAHFTELMETVRKQVSEKFPEFSDLFALDFLLYFISTQPDTKSKTVPPEITVDDFDHDAVIEQVLELGDGLGFEVDSEFTVMRGCRIDAIWRSRVANLGTIAYAFEVHRKGSRDSAILNLQRVRRDPAIQKVIIVSSREELAKFQQEISSLEEGFRTSVGYFEVQELQDALEHLQDLKDIMKTLGLLRQESFLDIARE